MLLFSDMNLSSLGEGFSSVRRKVVNTAAGALLLNGVYSSVNSQQYPTDTYAEQVASSTFNPLYQESAVVDDIESVALVPTIFSVEDLNSAILSGHTVINIGVVSVEELTKIVDAISEFKAQADKFINFTGEFSAFNESDDQSSDEYAVKVYERMFLLSQHSNVIRGSTTNNALYENIQTFFLNPKARTNEGFFAIENILEDKIVYAINDASAAYNPFPANEKYQSDKLKYLANNSKFGVLGSLNVGLTLNSSQGNILSSKNIGVPFMWMPNNLQEIIPSYIGEQGVSHGPQASLRALNEIDNIDSPDFLYLYTTINSLRSVVPNLKGTTTKGVKFIITSSQLGYPAGYLDDFVDTFKILDKKGLFFYALNNSAGHTRGSRIAEIFDGEPTDPSSFFLYPDSLNIVYVHELVDGHPTLFTDVFSTEDVKEVDAAILAGENNSHVLWTQRSCASFTGSSSLTPYMAGKIVNYILKGQLPLDSVAINQFLKSGGLKEDKFGDDIFLNTKDAYVNVDENFLGKLFPNWSQTQIDQLKNSGAKISLIVPENLSQNETGNYVFYAIPILDRKLPWQYEIGQGYSANGEFLLSGLGSVAGFLTAEIVYQGGKTESHTVDLNTARGYLQSAFQLNTKFNTLISFSIGGIAYHFVQDGRPITNCEDSIPTATPSATVEPTLTPTPTIEFTPVLDPTRQANYLPVIIIR